MQSELRNQTVVVIGGTSGIGLEAARRARAEGAQVILTARHPERLEEVALDVDALTSAAFDANDFASLESFFLAVPTSDVAALAVHIMSNTALTGATYDIDGGQQLV
jgi:short-subunit dehydrogenase involved in D-alanine esterification of teichoic acids